MEKIILIKYGELTTKKGNRNQFIDVLERNIKNKLNNIEFKIKRNRVRMFIETNEIDVVVDKLKYVFGIHSIVVCERIESNIDVIKQRSLELLQTKEFNTFKVETKRSDKSFELKSMEVSRDVGAFILENISNIGVDVKDPEILLNVEIRDDYTYISTNENKGLGGYPVGIQGKGMLMLSGGIDSPVAGFLALKRGVNLEAIYFESLPHTSLKARKKVIDLTRLLAKYTNKINLHVVPFTEIQETIYKEIDHSYGITIMRRMMYRISEKLSKQHKAIVLINGENIGQVASQTLTSINAINNVVNIPVIRPVACMDKIEIIEIAKKINTYETSILPYEDCCTIFVPKHPVINPDLETCVEYEKDIDFDKMIENCMEKVETIVINEKENNNDIL